MIGRPALATATTRPSIQRARPRFLRMPVMVMVSVATPTVTETTKTKVTKRWQKTRKAERPTTSQPTSSTSGAVRTWRTLWPLNSVEADVPEAKPFESSRSRFAKNLPALIFSRHKRSDSSSSKVTKTATTGYSFFACTRARILFRARSKAAKSSLPASRAQSLLSKFISGVFLRCTVTHLTVPNLWKKSRHSLGFQASLSGSTTQTE
mmetsp:Transcript_30530/g.105510  ORF Transcript_30530/g.105510 Transcript_30530/m.105510 type:complete len:208 (+) Transcript_30530:1058-1681(+)